MVIHFNSLADAARDLLAHGFGISLRSGVWVSADGMTRATVYKLPNSNVVRVFYEKVGA